MVHHWRWRWIALLTLTATTAWSGCAANRPIEPIRTDAERLFDRGDYARAAKEYAEIVERYPGDWMAQYRLGQCHLELGSPDEARRALEIAHTRQPADDDVADALAEAMFLEGDSNGLFAFLRSRASATQTAHAYERLAYYAVEMGDPDSAKVALDAAIELDKGRSVEPYLAAAEFAQNLGNLDLAVRRLRQAYGINPRDERVSKRLIALGEVPGPTIALPPGR